MTSALDCMSVDQVSLTNHKSEIIITPWIQMVWSCGSWLLTNGTARAAEGAGLRGAEVSHVGIQRHDQGEQAAGQRCLSEWLTSSFGGRRSNL